jgi:hypothetical protein
MTFTAFNKTIAHTDKSVFRIEVRAKARGEYLQEFAHADPVHAIRYYNSTVKPAGFRVRLIKDGDEFVIIDKKDF